MGGMPHVTGGAFSDIWTGTWTPPGGQPQPVSRLVTVPRNAPTVDLIFASRFSKPKVAIKCLRITQVPEDPELDQARTALNLKVM